MQRLRFSLFLTAEEEEELLGVVLSELELDELRASTILRISALEHHMLRSLTHGAPLWSNFS